MFDIFIRNQVRNLGEIVYFRGEGKIASCHVASSTLADVYAGAKCQEVVLEYGFVGKQPCALSMAFTACSHATMYLYLDEPSFRPVVSQHRHADT